MQRHPRPHGSLLAAIQRPHALKRVVSGRTRFNHTRLMEQLTEREVKLLDGLVDKEKEEAAAAAAVNVKAVGAILREVEQTEEAYLRALSTLCDDFLRPLRASKKLKREDEMTVFNNCEQLRGVATALLAQIQGAGGEADIESRLRRTADAFTHMAPVLISFGEYCAGQMAGQERLTALRAESSAVNALVLAAEKGCGEPVGSLLVRPLQRVCKYPLFLCALKKELPAGHVARSAVETAAAKVGEIVQEVNERVRAAEARQRWVQATRSLGAPELVAPGRVLLLETSVGLLADAQQAGRENKTYSPARAGRLWLCNDLVLARSVAS